MNAGRSWKVKVQAIRFIASLSGRPGLEFAMSDCLPILAEPLISMTQDPHPKVNAIAVTTLDVAMGTIDNIETQKLKPLIMKGLVSAGGAPACLAEIMELTFVNAISAPSLAVRTLFCLCLLPSVGFRWG